jgi:hypothetical protein
LLVTSFSIWLGKSPRRGLRIAAWLISALAIVLAVPQLSALANSTKAESIDGDWKKFSEAAVSEAQSRHQ